MDVIDQIEPSIDIEIYESMLHWVSMDRFSQIDIKEYESMECTLATQLYIRTLIEK
jgi:hypothetical protein